MTVIRCNDQVVHTSRLAASAVAVLSLSLIGSLVTPAAADTRTVDLDDDVSAGRVIVGTGQNMPSMNSDRPWDIGSYPQRAIIEYHRDQAATDQAAVAAAAVLWTRAWLKRACPSLKPADIRECKATAVFDMDDTIVSTYPVGATNDPPFSYDPARSDAAEETCSTPIIGAARQAYETFRAWGMATVLITGRRESQRQATIDCLAEYGLADWDAIRLRQPGNELPAAQWKAQLREGFIDEGYRIGPSIGDQVSDMSYGALTRGFLMPNVRYYLP